MCDDNAKWSNYALIRRAESYRIVGLSILVLERIITGLGISSGDVERREPHLRLVKSFAFIGLYRGYGRPEEVWGSEGLSGIGCAHTLQGMDTAWPTKLLSESHPL